MPATPPDAHDGWSRDDDVADTGGRRSGRRDRGRPVARPMDDVGMEFEPPRRAMARPRPLTDGPYPDGPYPDGPYPGADNGYPDGGRYDDGYPDDGSSGDDDPEAERVLAPARRPMSLALAGLSALLALAMVVGAQLAGGSFAFVVFGMQVLFVVVWIVASQPPAPRIVAAVGIGVAAAADIATALAEPPSLAPLAYLTACGFVAGVVGQLLRRVGRVRVTESLGSTLVVVVGVIAFATLVVLSRSPLGAQVIVACALGAGAALAVAHLLDLVLLAPRVADTVPRGAVGVVVGAMVATAVAGAAGHLLEGLSTLPTALAGMASAVIALMVDMSATYAETGRRLAGVPPSWWLVRHMQGPLTAFALAAPTAYAASLVLARGL